ncbi:MAG: carboxypeptidase-like regulatory domain-containing protein [Candidatus Nitrosopolaris sp.]
MDDHFIVIKETSLYYNEMYIYSRASTNYPVRSRTRGISRNLEESRGIYQLRFRHSCQPKSFIPVTDTSLELKLSEQTHTGTLPVSLFGKLTSDHSPVDGASIIITGTGEGKQFSVTTNQFGSYGSQVSLGPGTHKIEAYFAGDSDHTSSSATRVVTVK